MYRIAISFAMAVLLAGVAMVAPGTVAAAWDPPAAVETPSNTAQDDGGHSTDSSAVQLTEKQKKRLAKAYDRLFQAHTEIIELYAEYGIISQEQKERKIEWLKKRREQIEAAGFRPCEEKHSTKPHHWRDEHHHGETSPSTP